MSSNVTLDTRPEKLLSVNDVQDILNVSIATVNRLMASGKLKRVKIGGRVRIRPSDVQAYIESVTQ